VIAALAPSIVIFGNDISPLTQILIKSCKVVGIPTLLLQDAIKSDVPNREGFFFARRTIMEASYRFKEMSVAIHSNAVLTLVLSGIKKFALGLDYGHGGCDAIAVFGERFRHTLISQGIPSDKIFPVGQPKYEKILSRTTNRYKVPLPGTNVSRIIVGFTTQPFVEIGMATREHRRIAIEQFVRSIREVADVQLALKLHPRESLGDYKEILSELGKANVLLFQDIDLFEFLSGCDVIVTVHSTTGLEAMMLGKPVICVNLFGMAFGQSFYNGSGAVMADSPEDMRRAIESLLKDSNLRSQVLKKQYKFVMDHLGQMDGKASERFSHLIESMISKSGGG
jgi:glycosyltransferase involved in cell wall biosynthesis